MPIYRLVFAGTMPPVEVYGHHTRFLTSLPQAIGLADAAAKREKRHIEVERTDSVYSTDVCSVLHETKMLQCVHADGCSALGGPCPSCKPVAKG